MLSDKFIINVNSLAWSKIGVSCMWVLIWTNTWNISYAPCLTVHINIIPCSGSISVPRTPGDCISSWFTFYQHIPTLCSTSKQLGALSPCLKNLRRTTFPVSLIPAIPCLVFPVPLPAGSVFWLPFLLPSSTRWLPGFLCWFVVWSHSAYQLRDMNPGTSFPGIRKRKGTWLPVLDKHFMETDISLL